MGKRGVEVDAGGASVGPDVVTTRAGVAVGSGTNTLSQLAIRAVPRAPNRPMIAIVTYKPYPDFFSDSIISSPFRLFQKCSFE